MVLPDIIRTMMTESNIEDNSQQRHLLEGVVKWFSNEKGYGYIVAEDGRDHYFSVTDVCGADLPGKGFRVGFHAVPGKRGPRAKGITILSKGIPNNQETKSKADDRETCTHCGKRMFPRLVLSQGVAVKSLCPFCGNVHKKFNEGCFIATAVYADPYAAEVIAIRRFRDETLLKTWFGQSLVSLYYRCSPLVARFLSRTPRAAQIIRPLLDRLSKAYDAN